MVALPYVTSPGNVERALRAIKDAATPPNVNQDFVKTVLKIPGGSGNQITAYLKKIGFVHPDGAPTEIYTRFRNSSSAGKAAADALKLGYAPLEVKNEYWYKLSDEKLRDLIVEVTGVAKDANVASLTLACIKGLKKFANFDAEAPSEGRAEPIQSPSIIQPPALPPIQERQVGLRLGYTINLNLPPTSDIAVFNAIFRSLRENLLKATPDEN